MAKRSLYLHFDGRCEEAFNLYATIFGNKITGIFRYKDIPHQKGMPQIPDKDLNKIENIGLSIGESLLLMGSDNLEIFGQKTIAGNNFSIYIEADSKEQADSQFNSLSEDGIIKMPMATAHWGDYFGMCTDPESTGLLISPTKRSRHYHLLVCILPLSNLSFGLCCPFG